jgi:hypothetical protein
MIQEVRRAKKKQRDSTSGFIYEPEGREFESLRARHSSPSTASRYATLSSTASSSVLGALGATSRGEISKPSPIGLATALRNSTSSRTFEYPSVTSFIACPSQNLIRSSGARCFRTHAVRNLRNAWNPVFSCPSAFKIGCRLRRSVFVCESGVPVARREQKAGRAFAYERFEHRSESRGDVNLPERVASFWHLLLAVLHALTHCNRGGVPQWP